MAGLVEPESTRWEIPGHVFPPESLGPCAIAGERFAEATSASVAAASNNVFTSDLTRDDAGVIRAGGPGCADTAISTDRRSMSVGELTAAMPIETVSPVVLFRDVVLRFRLGSRRVNFSDRFELRCPNLCTK